MKSKMFLVPWNSLALQNTKYSYKIYILRVTIFRHSFSVPVEAKRELLELAQRTDFGRMRWTRPKHALEGCQLQLVCGSSCI
jgi:hypothetical protein